MEFVGQIFAVFVILTLHGSMHKSVTKFIHTCTAGLTKTVQAECDCTAFAMIYRKKRDGLNRDLNPGPPAPEAGIIPLDH